MATLEEEEGSAPALAATCGLCACLRTGQCTSHGKRSGAASQAPANDRHPGRGACNCHDASKE